MIFFILNCGISGEPLNQDIQKIQCSLTITIILDGHLYVSIMEVMVTTGQIVKIVTTPNIVQVPTQMLFEVLCQLQLVMFQFQMQVVQQVPYKTTVGRTKSSPRKIRAGWEDEVIMGPQKTSDGGA